MIIAHVRRTANTLVVAVAAIACSAGAADAPPSTDAQSPAAPPPALIPAADSLAAVTDSVAERLVFAPVVQREFVAAVRGKALVVDLGRADIEIAKSARRAAAFQRAVAERAPIATGSTLVLRGPWGWEEARITGFDVRGGRIVGLLGLGARADSAVRTSSPIIATATRPDSTPPAATTECDTTDFAAARARAKVVRDSLLAQLQAAEQPLYERLAKSVKSKASMVLGCFGRGHALVVATYWGGDYEWVREDAVLIADNGRPVDVPIRDFRFRAHEFLSAFDGDGDGRHDVAARATGTRVGATVVLRLTEKGALERLAAGFAWER